MKGSTSRRWSSLGGGSFDSEGEGGAEGNMPQRPATPSLPVFTIRPRTAVANPKPKPNKDDGTLIMDMEDAMGLGSLITEGSLKSMTGESDLSQVTYLELSVNTTDQSVAQIGELCPNLIQLKLNDSFLQSIRDLGTAVRNLQVLWLSRCGVTDLDGISVLENLTELYLSFNNVEDITPLSLHDHLEVLDLEGNKLSSVDQLDALGTCMRLNSLCLLGNPMARRPGYRRLVHHHIPQLQLLDDAPLSAADREPPTEAMILAAVDDPPPPAQDPDVGDYTIATLAASDLGSLESTSMASPLIRHHLHRLQCGSPVDLSLSTASPQRPVTGSPIQFAPLSTSRRGSFFAEGGIAAPDATGRRTGSASSMLTHGSSVIFAGNPVLSIRRRRVSGDQETLARPRTAIQVLDETRDLNTATHGAMLEAVKSWDLEPSAPEGGMRPQSSSRSLRRSTLTPTPTSRTPAPPDILILPDNPTDGDDSSVPGYPLSSNQSEDEHDRGLGAHTRPFPARASSTSSRFRSSDSRLPSAGSERSFDSGTSARSPVRGIHAALVPPSSAPASDASSISLPPQQLQYQVAPSSGNDLGCRSAKNSDGTSRSRSHRPRSRSSASRLLAAQSDDGDMTARDSPSRLGSASSSGLPPTHHQSSSSSAAALGNTVECSTPPRSKPPRSKPPAALPSGLYSPMLPPTDAAPSPTGMSAASSSSAPLLASGEGVTIPDKDLIELLRQRPKQVPMLRSRDSFRRFFRGIAKTRMELLLQAAFRDLEAVERDDKVTKRLALLEGVMT